MEKSVVIRTILILTLFLWVTVIFTMSSQPAVKSSQTSSSFVVKLIDVVYCDFETFSTKQQASITHTITFIVRKTAHFLEYFILGLLSAGVAATYRRQSQCLNFVGAIVFSVIYAISDEVHQYFVPGRACKFLDICIDSAGSICAVAMMALIISAYKRHKSGETNAKKEIN